MKLTRVEKLLLILDFVKDSLQNFWQKFYGANLLKASACLSVLLITLIIVFSSKPQAQALPSCSTLASTVVPNPGVNCLYYGLPLCSSIVAPVRPQHRVNCADIIDLPLCSDIVTGGGVSANPGRNCVDLCSSPSYNSPDPTGHPEWERGIDFAIFNRDCLRFCNDVEPGIVPVAGANCVERKCHQLTPADVPNPGVNCNLLPCNLLTPDELNKAKFDDDTKKYCDGDVKCHRFTQTQLPYMKLRAVNATCQIHDCRPPIASCGPDDTLNITNQGAAYTDVYTRYINGNLSLNSSAVCRSLSCKPVIQAQYRCVSQPVRDASGRFNIHSVGTLSSMTGTADDIYRNPNCDTSGAGSLCGTLRLGATPDLDTITSITNFCFKTVDCNLPGNISATECLVASNLAGDTTTNVDPFNSWFYRPKPMDKAINRATGILKTMQPELCYTTSQMNDDHGFGEHIVIDLGPFGEIDMGWFQSSWWDLRSPGSCNTTRDGFRGTGYIYLCGTAGLLYNRPSQDATYFKGYATTTFNNGVATHKVTVCTRFKNTVSLDTCGTRECGINEWFSRTTSQACGSDVCRELTITDSDEARCMMSSNGGSGPGCSASLGGGMDGYMRVRAVKYNDKICAYLDSKGQLAYNGMFFDGTESINFGGDDELNPGIACVNDPSGINGNCNGFNSNSDAGIADVWRTLQRVHYVDNNRPASTPPTLKGYIDKNGKLYKEQACPKVTLRLPPPDLYNVGTISNSEKLFAPPISIRNATKIRGGDDAIIPPGKLYGRTDFHYPELKVQFGSGIYKMSLGFGFTGDESGASAENYAAAPSTRNITTNFNGKDYQARLFVKKEFFNNIDIPQFCLYRRIKDQNGIDIEPLRIGCVDRDPPYISSAKDRIVDPSLPVRRMLVYPKGGNEYNNAKINMRYLDGGANRVDNNCSGDDVCSPEISLGNPDYRVSNCNQDTDSHKLCVRREECSAIYIDCIQNEIDINNARNQNQDLSYLMGIRRQCNESLVPGCNRKKGVTSGSGDIFAPISSNTVVDPENIYYGWFNELCIVNGFEDRLRMVIAHDTPVGEMGKCFISQSSPYITDGNPATNCNNGGVAPNCICAEAPQGYVTNAGEIVRLETPREAGLCIDMPLPTFCPIIDYTPLPNTDANDTEYVSDSLRKNTYNNTGGVHLTHRDRTNGTISGHAEFSQSLPGMNDVRGTCKGFWTYDKNSSGVILFPQQSCLNNAGTAVWDLNVRNQCIRFSCPDVVTAGPDVNGVYQAGYGALESGEEKGTTNAFATWLKYTKTNDFMETRTARACVPGFKPLGSSAVTNTAGLITGYNGGALPSRQCDQLGNWAAPVNACARIACPAINLRRPASSADATLWAQWYANGGASFPSVLASRSVIRTQANSVSTGTCDESIGFFQSPGGLPPTLDCDYLGNWGVVRNPCTTSCEAITDEVQALNGNNGNSKWNRITSVLTVSGVPGVFTGCATADYVTNPYPPTVDINGVALSSAVANDITRPAENPRRLCKVGSNNAGAMATVWGAVTNGCINKCPGADVDPRIGVGTTTHPLRSSLSGVINLIWASTDLGQYAYVSSWTQLQSQFNASYFQGSSTMSRTNNHYLVRRYCNLNGKWSDPEPMCAANDGQISNAKYFSSASPAGFQNSIPAGATQTVGGVCVSSSYWTSARGTGPAPLRKCVFADANRYIDRVYLELTNGTLDCELKTCTAYTGFTGSRGSIAAASPIISNASPPITDQRFIAGSGQIVGGCIGNTSLVGAAPHVDCDANGNWTAPLDEGSCKFSCIVYNNSLAPNYILKHNYYLRTSSTWSWWDDDGDQECQWDTRGYSCNDGALTANSDISGWGNENCCCTHYAQKYTPATNSFCGRYTVSRGISDVVTGLITPGMTCQ